MQIITTPRNIVSNRGFVATIGMFDGVHRGHEFLMEKLNGMARENGMSSLAVTFQNHPLSVIRPGETPGLLTTAAERSALLEKTGIDACYLINFTEEVRNMSARDFVDLLRKELNVRGIMAGFDHRFGNRNDDRSETLEEIAQESGMLFCRCDEFRDDCGVGKISSSNIRNLISAGNVFDAAELLGRRYSFSGKVVRGRQLGSRIGFPTANVEPFDKEKLLPGNGVYACEAFIGDFVDGPLGAVVNIGFNPTVSEGRIRTIEAHIPGLSKETDLYGRSITLRFVRFIRNERKFDSIESLRHQIGRDLLSLSEINL